MFKFNKFKLIPIKTILFTGALFLSHTNAFAQADSTEVVPPDFMPIIQGYVLASGISPLMACISYVAQDPAAWNFGGSSTQKPAIGPSCNLGQVTNSVCDNNTSPVVTFSVIGGNNTSGGSCFVRQYSLSGNVNTTTTSTGSSVYELYIQNAYNQLPSQCSENSSLIQFSYTITCIPTE